MPRKPKHPCSYPGCPNLTYSRYCEEHERFMMRRYNSVERNPRAKKLLGYILFRYDEDETILLDVLTIPATIIIRLLFPSYKSLSNADAEMVSEYRKTHESAGAILLIAASSDAEGMEIRKAMLEELEKAEKDREISRGIYFFLPLAAFSTASAAFRYPSNSTGLMDRMSERGHWALLPSATMP